MAPALVPYLFVIRRIGSPGAAPPVWVRGGRGPVSPRNSPVCPRLYLCCRASCASLQLPAAFPLDSALGPRLPVAEPLPADPFLCRPQRTPLASALQAVGSRVSHHWGKGPASFPQPLPHLRASDGPLSLGSSCCRLLLSPAPPLAELPLPGCWAPDKPDGAWHTGVCAGWARTHLRFELG